MSIFEEIIVGQEIVIKNGRLGGSLFIVAVTKISKARITVNSDELGIVQFNRRNGIKIGDSDSWYKTKIADKWTQRDGLQLITPDEAREEIERKKNQQQRYGYIDIIRKSSRASFDAITTEELRNMAQKLTGEKINSSVLIVKR